MVLMRPPGVYQPQGDTRLLSEVMTADLPHRARVLDVGTGTGALAVAAAMGGKANVTAIDISRRAVWTAKINAWLSGTPIRVLHGDLFAPVTGEEFDLIVANPPYVPGPGLPRRGRAARAWDGGTRGRMILDRICHRAPAMLAPGGTFLLVHSALCGPSITVRRLVEGGLDADVIARRAESFGPVMHARASWLESQRLIRRGQRQEELVVIRAHRSR
jgi:release factor glutamine methyltransferase